MKTKLPDKLRPVNLAVMRARRNVRRLDRLYVLSFALVTLGIVVLVLTMSHRFANTGVVQVIGGGLLGTGLTALISAVATGRAISEQYAKEANLRRKQTSYGPLFRELKSVREHLEAADQGKQPYPIEINLQVDQIGTRGLWRDVIPLYEWSRMRADERAEDFTELTTSQLESMRQSAISYNKAFDALREPARMIVGRSANLAIKVLLATTEYKQWGVVKADRAKHPQPVGHGTASPVDWCATIDAIIAYAETVGKTPGIAMVDEWLEQWPQPQAARTLGFLLASGPVGAASYVHESYQSPYATPAPPKEWIEGIFEDAWPNLQSHAAFYTVRTTFSSLLDKVCRAEASIGGALRRIRDRFEGGAPIV